MKKILIILSAILLVIIPSFTVYADADDINASYSGLIWAPDGLTGVSCGDDSVVLVGRDNIERAFNFFVQQKGLSEAESAGIVGNLIYESGVDPTRKEGSGYQTFSSADEIVPGTGFGIAQWTSEGRQLAWIALAEELGQEVTDLGLQLEFLWQELTTNLSSPNYGYVEIQEADDDARQAAWIFLAFFEKPQTVVDSGTAEDPNQPTSGAVLEVLNARHNYALEVLDNFGGVSVGSGNCSSLDTSEPDFSASGVRVDGSPPWDGGANCTGEFTEGAKVLQDFILDVWQPPVTSIGGYNCRPNTANPSETSIHGVGRALDIMISALDPATLIVGDQIRNWLINNSVEIGVQRIIWNNYTWSSDQDGWNPYTGPNPHTDHIHVEINEDGANMLTSWFQGR